MSIKANAAVNLSEDLPTMSAHKARWLDYFALTKPTITLLVVVTVVPGLIWASPSLPSPLTALAALIGAMLASASAAVFNQVLESDLDGHMHRTRGRSLASGRVAKVPAISFGLLLGSVAMWILYRWASPLAALCALGGHFFYVFIYTLFLKRRTAQNIVIGGAAGAVGPLIGWAAVRGELAWPAWVMFAIIFLWTPPHFWALALKYKADYAAAGVPMYPVVYGDAKTRDAIFFYTLSLLPCVVLLYFYEGVGATYLVVAVAATLRFIYDAWQLKQSADNQKAMPLFHYSCFYTFGVFGVLSLDRFVGLLLA